MDWISQIEKHKLLLVGIVLLIAISTLIITSLRIPIGNDLFWHLQMGRDWLDNGLSPWIDHYSFTYSNHKITNPPVAFQGLLHLAVSQFGLSSGFQIVRFGCFLLTLGASLLLLRQMKAPAIIYALVIPMIVFLLQMRSMVRPELFSYTLSIIALMLYFRAGNKISSRHLVPMTVLMLVWSSYHSSVIGYVIFFGFFLDCAIQQFESRAPAAVWIKWLAWGLLIVAVGFLNHGFSHPMLQAITFPSEWKIFINEYLPPTFLLKSFGGIYVLILVAALTPVMAYQQRRFGILVIWAVLTYSALTMGRMVTPSGIVIVMLAAYLIHGSDIFHRDSLAGDKVRSKYFALAFLISIGAILYSNIKGARFFIDENQSVISRYPIAMTDYMKEQSMSGRIFNDYNMGGYLIYRLAPQNQVYIDGRTVILYPLEHMKKYYQIDTTRSPEVLREELDKYSIDQIIWNHSQTKNDLVQEMGGFGLDYIDDRYALYTRGTSNFPILGKLMSSPACWRSDMLDELNAERSTMQDILPDDSLLFPFANLVVGYPNADDGKAFFDSSIEGREWLDEMRRFAGFRSITTGQYDLAVILFGGVKFKMPKDFLASAMAKMKEGDYLLASHIINDFSSIQWRRLQPEDIFVYYKLYQMLEKQRDLTEAERNRIEILKTQLLKLGFSGLDPSHVIDVNSFCPVP